MANRQMVPVGATFNRTTGQIRIDWAECADSFRRFGEIMLRIGRDHQAQLDTESRNKYTEKRMAEDGTGSRDHVLL